MDQTRLYLPLVATLLWGCGAPDGDNLAFYVGKPTKGTGPEGVYAYDVVEETSRLLVEGRGDNLRISPDGTRLVLTYAKPVKGGQVSSVTAVVAVEDGREVASGEQWSPTGWLGNDRLFEVEASDTAYTIWKRKLDGSARELLFRSDAPRRIQSRSSSPNGRTLLWAESLSYQGTDALYALDLHTRVVSRTLPMGQATEVLGSAPLFLPDGQIGWTNLDSTELFVSDLAFKQIKRRVISGEPALNSSSFLELAPGGRLFVSRNAKSRFKSLMPGAGVMEPLPFWNELEHGLFGNRSRVEMSRSRTFALVRLLDQKTFFARPDGSELRPAPKGISDFQVR